MSEAKPTSFRLDAETEKILGDLVNSMGVSRVQVVRLALRLLAKRERVRAT